MFKISDFSFEAWDRNVNIFFTLQSCFAFGVCTLHAHILLLKANVHIPSKVVHNPDDHCQFYHWLVFWNSSVDTNTSLVFFLICWQSLGFVLSMLVAEQLMDFLKRSAFLSTSTKRFALLNAFWNSDPSKVGLGFFLHLISSKLGTLEASCASNKNFLCTPSCCSTSTALE